MAAIKRLVVVDGIMMKKYLFFLYLVFSLGADAQLPKGLDGNTYQLQKEDILFVTHLSTQWDHSTRTKKQAPKIVTLMRQFPHSKIVHLRGLTPLWQRKKLLKESSFSFTKNYYFIDPPISSYFKKRLKPYLQKFAPRRKFYLEKLRYPDPYILDHSVAIVWEKTFERAIYSHGGGFYFAEPKEALLRKDKRYQRYLKRVVYIPKNSTKFVLVGGWFHACLTRTVKDIMINTIIDNAQKKIDIIMPARAVFINSPSKKGTEGSIDLYQKLQSLSLQQRQKFFQERLGSIYRYILHKKKQVIATAFIYRGQKYRTSSKQTQVFIWVADKIR